MFLLWLGLAALLVGLMSFVINPSWQVQVDVRRVRGRRRAAVAALRAQTGAASVSNTFLNRRSDALVGRVFTLEKPIIDGIGTVRIDDTVWRVAGPDRRPAAG